MSQSSAAIPREESEFEFCGFESAPSYRVSVPRVAQSPATLEYIEWSKLETSGYRWRFMPELVQHRRIG